MCVETGKTMPMLERLCRPARYASTTGFSASALIGCTGLPSAPSGTCFFIAAQTSFATVIAVAVQVHRERGDDVRRVPKPMVAPSGWPASMCAPSSSPVITRSSSTFQFACGSSVT